jgi:hypothetical protein
MTRTLQTSTDTTLEGTWTWMRRGDDGRELWAFKSHGGSRLLGWLTEQADGTVIFELLDTDTRYVGRWA